MIVVLCLERIERLERLIKESKNGDKENEHIEQGDN